jgi:hypothetical protein
MSRTQSTEVDNGKASGQQQDSADAEKLAADTQAADQRANDHRNQIRSLAHAAVQSMVTAHRKK